MTNRQIIRKGVVNAIPLLAMLVGILIFHNSRCSAPDMNDPRVVGLKKLASEIPVYEGSQKTREKVVMKSTLVYYSVYYQSSAKFSEVKFFYDRVLREKGFARPQQDQPPTVLTGSYRRGNYEIAVEGSDREPENFELVFIWDPQ